MKGPLPPVRFLSRNRVEFRYEPRVWGGVAARSVALTGSFTNWQPRWVLRRRWGHWAVVLPREQVALPGNSGEPEFRFVADGVLLACPDVAGWPRAGDNAVVPLQPRDPESREALHQTAVRLKTRLDEYGGEDQLANFRPVIEGRLYRSYHPFLTSRETPVEAPRLQAVTRLMSERQIGCVINLTDGPQVLDEAEVPPLYRTLASEGRVLFAETSYEDAYYRPRGAAFGAVVGRVLGFVADHPGPYLVHCRLGMDRTGVVTALLAGLGGLPWSALVADYLKSNELGIREYRDQALLAHSFDLMLGRPVATVTDLSTALLPFCLGHGVAPDVLARAQRNLR